MSEYNAFDYVPIAIMFLVAAGFGVSQLLVTQLIGPRKRTAVKLMPYECGKDPIGRRSRSLFDQVLHGRGHLSAVRYRSPVHSAVRGGVQEPDRGGGTGVAFGTIAFVEIMVFIATLIVGYIYVWKKGIFDWGLQARAEAARKRS